MCNHSPNREAAMVVVERDAQGTPTVWCDPCLVPLITALNAAGIRTRASCCGHGYQPGWIMLQDGRHLHIYPDDTTHRLVTDATRSLFPLDINGWPR